MLTMLTSGAYGAPEREAYYRMEGGEEEELPESPAYNHSGFQDSLQYEETSASASNSGGDWSLET